MIIKYVFYILSFLLILSSLSVISLQNSIHSSMSLVICFITSSGILLILECEFYSLLFLILYVGAIAVLFLFVIMMLDLKDLNVNTTIPHLVFSVFIPLTCIIVLIPFIKNFFDLSVYSKQNFILVQNVFDNYYSEDDSIEIEVLGQVLYTVYLLQFLLIGLILSLAILCISLLVVQYNKLNTEIQELLVSRSVFI